MATKCEKIMLSHRPKNKRLSDAEWLHFMRSENRQYECDEAPYYVESIHPEYREDRPNFHVPVLYFAWSMAAARKRVYTETKRGWKAAIYNNQTDEIINP